MTRRKAIIAILIGSLTALMGWWSFCKARLFKASTHSISDFRVLIEDVAEIILPRTSTPGAKDAKVGSYIVNVVEYCFSEKDRKTVLDGLNGVEQYCQSHYQLGFSRCSTKAKIDCLKAFETKSIYSSTFIHKIRNVVFGRSFLDLFKWLTVSGYSQSEFGATKGFAYEHTPNQYISCVPYKPGQKSWATK